MFAYCENNPVNCSDPSGNAYQGIYSQINYNEHDHTYGGRRENFYAGSSQAYVEPTGTVIIGLGGIAMAGKGGSISIGFTFDFRGNMGIIFIPFVGGGFPTAGFYAFGTVTNAQTIYDQEKWAGQLGGSGTFLGYEYSIFLDPAVNSAYHGHTLSAGFTPNALPVEVHGGASYSILRWTSN